MNTATQPQPLTVSISSPWQDEFSAHIAKNYRNAKTAALVHQHVREFS
jgi:hypothetical protein